MAIGYYIIIHVFLLCKSTSLIAIHIGMISWHHSDYLTPFTEKYHLGVFSVKGLEVFRIKLIMHFVKIDSHHIELKSLKELTRASLNVSLFDLIWRFQCIDEYCHVFFFVHVHHYTCIYHIYLINEPKYVFVFKQMILNCIIDLWISYLFEFLTKPWDWSFEYLFSKEKCRFIFILFFLVQCFKYILHLHVFHS